MIEDNERFVGNYLIVLGTVSVISVILSNFVFKHLRVDPTGLFLIWAGIMLRKHSRVTAKLVVVLFTLMVLLIPVLTLLLLFTGAGKVGVLLLGYQLHNPPKWLAIFMMIVTVSVYFATPAVLLRRVSRQPNAKVA